MDSSWAAKLYEYTCNHPEVVLPVGAALMAVLFFLKKPAAAIYVALIPLVNWSFANVPTIPMWDGGNWSPFAVVTGLVLVVRDFAQREVGHRIFFYMALGLVMSALTTPPQIVLASGLAFAISETTDWAIFTFTKQPLSKRILWSTAASAPLGHVGILVWGEHGDPRHPGLVDRSDLDCVQARGRGDRLVTHPETRAERRQCEGRALPRKRVAISRRPALLQCKPLIPACVR